MLRCFARTSPLWPPRQRPVDGWHSGPCKPPRPAAPLSTLRSAHLEEEERDSPKARLVTAITPDRQRRLRQSGNGEYAREALVPFTSMAKAITPGHIATAITPGIGTAITPLPDQRKLLVIAGMPSTTEKLEWGRSHPEYMRFPACARLRLTATTCSLRRDRRSHRKAAIHYKSKILYTPPPWQPFRGRSPARTDLRNTPSSCNDLY